MEHNMYVYYGSMFVYNVSVCCVIHSSSSSGRWDLLRNTQKRSGEPNAGKNDSTDSNYANGLLLAHHVLPFAPLSLTPSLSLSLTPSSLWSTVVIVKSWHFDNIVSIPPIWSDSIIMFRMEFHLLCALENSSHHNLQVRIMFLIA